MAFKKKVVAVEETPVTVQVKNIEKPIVEKRDFSIIERETKTLKVIKKSEYRSELHIAI